MLQSIPDNILTPNEFESFSKEYIEDQLLDIPQAAGTKYCIHAAGIPGSGKSTILQGWKTVVKPYSELPILTIGNDNIMQSMPGYYEKIRREGAQKAFDSYELPARAIGYELLSAAVSKGVNILLDHSATAEYRPDLINELQQRGYKVIMIYTKCGVETALKRSKKREEETGRHVPESYFSERAKILEDLLPRYREIVDEFHEEDNS